MRLGASLRGGAVLLDGGLATELEARGHDLRGALWSARLLLDQPEAVLAAHHAFTRAGARVATTASYQLSARALAAAGHDPGLEAELLERSVQLARAGVAAGPSGGWVAGSVGPYGAALADGSEYTGDYRLPAARAHDALRRFHRPRMQGLLAAGADVLACETVPSLVEVRALAAELTALGADVASWLSVTVAAGPDGVVRTRAGDRLADVADAAAAVPGLVALGVNCCAPQDVEPALRQLVTADLPGLAYPNSGQTWSSAQHRWTGPSRWQPELPDRWVAAGARLVGGCCRVSPADLPRLP